MNISTNTALQEQIQDLKAHKKIIGLVPTMGALHEGHLSLVNFAYQYCDVVVVSIFVNPTQFNNSGDLEKYPRNFEKDYQLLISNNPKTIVYTPSINHVYGEDVKAEDFDFGSIVSYMEGQYRQGHFNGVGTVLKRLFAIVKPHKAFFGEKDFQQLQLVKKLVEITQQPVEVIGSPTLRMSNGLAESSRNYRLTPAEVEEASLIYKALSQAKTMFNDFSINEIKSSIQDLFEDHQLLELEYFEVAPTSTLIPAQTKKTHLNYRAFIAAYIRDVRLIDNLALN